MPAIIEGVRGRYSIAMVSCILAILCILQTPPAARATANAQDTYTVLHTVPQNYLAPECTLVEVSPGVFLGTLVLDGTTNTIIFRVTSTGEFASLSRTSLSQVGGWTEGPLLQASDGAIYGNTMGYGPNGLGTIFRANVKGAVSVLNSQIGYSSPLIEGGDGYLYGTGFDSSNSFGLYRLSRAGQIANFYPIPGSISVPGLLPVPPLIEASDGNFYGELYYGNGIIFQVTAQGAYNQLYESAALPVGGLTEGLDGRLYGATQGTVFSISTSGDYQTVHPFTVNDGLPQAGLTLASDGNLYGSTSWNQFVGNGPAGIFRVGLDGSGYSVVYSFGDQFAGIYTVGPSVIQGSDGKLYGVQVNGVDSQIFSLDLGLPKPQPAPLQFQPAGGPAGTRVLIAGKNMLGATGVSFDGTAATQFANRSGSYVEATVPAGAASGPITVTTANGQASTPGSFTVK